MILAYGRISNVHVCVHLRIFLIHYYLMHSVVISPLVPLIRNFLSIGVKSKLLKNHMSSTTNIKMLCLYFRERWTHIDRFIEIAFNLLNNGYNQC